MTREQYIAEARALELRQQELGRDLTELVERVRSESPELFTGKTDFMWVTIPNKAAHFAAYLSGREAELEYLRSR